MKSETAEEKVRQLLRPTDDTGWYQEVMSLDRSESVPVLIGILNDEQEKTYTRRQAAQMLGLLGDSRAVDALARSLSASDNILRGRAAEALGHFHELDAEIKRILIRGLHDEDPLFRRSSAIALGQIGTPEALPALERMIESEGVASNREIAKKAIESIRRAG